MTKKKENKINTLTRSMKLKKVDLSRSSLGATTTTIPQPPQPRPILETSILLIYNKNQGDKFYWDDQIPFYLFSPREFLPISDGKYYYRSDYVTSTPALRVPGADNLIGVTIPSSLTSIGPFAFDSSGLKTVYINFPQTISDVSFQNDNSNVDFFGATVTTRNCDVC